MKSNQSYIHISEEHTPNDKMILALKAKGHFKTRVVFAPKWDSDCGWTLVETSLKPTWLGFTRVEAMQFISNMPNCQKK